MNPNRSKRERAIETVIFVAYMIALVYFLLFAEMFGRSADQVHGHNFVPFHEIRRYPVYWKTIGFTYVILNLAGNVVAFMPFSMFLPVVLHQRPRWFVVVGSCMCFSVMVEVMQLITGLGTCDIDDVILNTLGGILGWLVYWIAHCIRRK